MEKSESVLNNIVIASITRKPNGVPLCLEILLNPDQVHIPATIERIDYNLVTENDGKTLTFQLQGCEESE